MKIKKTPSQVKVHKLQKWTQRREFDEPRNRLNSGELQIQRKPDIMWIGLKHYRLLLITNYTNL